MPLRRDEKLKELKIEELENNRASIEKTRDDLIKGYEKFKDSQK